METGAPAAAAFVRRAPEAPVRSTEQSLNLVEQTAAMSGTAKEATDTSIEIPPQVRTTVSTPTSVSVVASSSGPEPVTLVKKPPGQHGYVLSAKPKLEHNLLMAMGFMELANACDFAANVWNTEPVPVFALVLMAIGGTIAGAFSLFALMDSKLSWRNVRFLRQQRRGLLEVRAQRLKEAPHASVMDLDALLDISFRELGTEFISRWALDIFMGFGALLISAGTYMALGGRNRTIFLVSNLLSGYIGNAPVALIGLLNSAWAVYVWLKAQSHVNAAAALLPGTRAAGLMKRRSRNVQVYCVLNGITTVLGGAGSLITSTRWWGYVILIPVILSAIFCNFWWRTRVGYSRYDLVEIASRSAGRMDADKLSTALESAARAEVICRERGVAPLDGLVSDTASLYHVIHFIEEQNLLGPFCLRLVNDAKLRSAICGSSGESDEITLDVLSLCAAIESVHPAMIAHAQNLVHDMGLEHFKHLERYTAELLGSHLSLLLASRLQEHSNNSTNEMNNDGKNDDETPTIIKTLDGTGNA